MAKFKLKTIDRETSVTREAVRAAVAEVFADYIQQKKEAAGKTAKAKGKKAA